MFIVTSGNAAEFVHAEMCRSLASAASAQRRLNANFEATAIWEVYEGNEQFKPCLLEVNPNGDSTGQKREIDAFDHLF